MPIFLPFPFRRLTQVEFGELAYDVMRDVFAIPWPDISLKMVTFTTIT